MYIFVDTEDEFNPSFIDGEMKHKENKYPLWGEKGRC